MKIEVVVVKVKYMRIYNKLQFLVINFEIA